MRVRKKCGGVVREVVERRKPLWREFQTEIPWSGFTV